MRHPFALQMLALALLLPGCHHTQRQAMAAPVVAGPLASAALTAEITVLDQRLFELVFDRQDDGALRALLADDFQFHHDKVGMGAFLSADAFVAAIRSQFEGRVTGENLRARREVVPGTLAVYPMAQHGAIQTGEHRFYGLEAGQPDRLRETARYFHVWRRTEGGWRLAQVFSYDHRPAR